MKFEGVRWLREWRRPRMATVVVEGGCGNDGVQREKEMGVRGERE